MNAYQRETEITDETYEDYLNDAYGEIDVCGTSYPAGQVLREIDPTAFRCGKVDYESQLDEDHPVWVCNECGAEYDDEDEAEECCQVEEDKLSEEGFNPDEKS